MCEKNIRNLSYAEIEDLRKYAESINETEEIYPGKTRLQDILDHWNMQHPIFQGMLEQRGFGLK